MVPDEIVVPKRLFYAGIVGLGVAIALLLFAVVDSLVRNQAGPTSVAAQGIPADMNAEQHPGPTDGSDSALFNQVQAEVLPDEGVTLPIRWGHWLPELVRQGIIDRGKFEASFAKRGGLTADQKQLLAEGSDEFITINSKNSWFVVMALWPLGLANKMDINQNSPVAGAELSHFASTSGWSLGGEANGGAYFNKYEFVKLTQDQEAIVKDVAESSYRPCCNNSTFFQDCNHGSALLGLFELGASQGLSRKELAHAALVANSFWFPQNYMTTAMYFKVVKGIDWKDIDAEQVMGKDYSSASGANKVAQQVASLGIIPKGAFGAQCGV